MEEQITYESMMKEWVNTYQYCLAFEQQIKEQEIAEEEINEYLQEKARLIVCLGNLFAIKTVSEQGKYDVQFAQDLFANFKVEIGNNGLQLSEFDDQYIAEMIVEMEQDFIEAQEEAEQEEPVEE